MWFTVSATACATGSVVLNALQTSLTLSGVGPPQAWARNMAAATASRSKPDGWKGSWPVYLNEQLKQTQTFKLTRPIGVVNTELTKNTVFTIGIRRSRDRPEVGCLEVVLILI